MKTLTVQALRISGHGGDIAGDDLRALPNFNHPAMQADREPDLSAVRHGVRPPIADD